MARSSSLHLLLLPRPSRPVLVTLLVALVAVCNLHLAASSKAACLKTGGQAACPVNQASWKLSGCSGGIVDQDDSSSEDEDEDSSDDDSSSKSGRSSSSSSSSSEDSSKNLLYQFYSDLGTTVSSAAACKALCLAWPTVNGKKWTSLNGDSSKCAYWSWNGNADCFLYGCGVCKSASSFSTAVRYQNRAYVSGAGPAADSCPGSGVKGDPHFTGGDQSHFDFTGLPGQTYCLVSDSHLHINAYYGGRYDHAADAAAAGSHGKPLTWIRKLGLLWGHHTLQFVARHGAEWAYNAGYMARMEMDGQEVKLSQAGDSLSLADGSIQVKWLSAGERSGDDEVDVYVVSIRGVASLRLTLRPEVAALRTPQDGVVHINLDFEALDLSDTAHGVLGQTYRKDHKGRLAEQSLEFNDVLQVHMVKGPNAEGFLDGSVKDYASSDLLAADCAVSRFARLSALDSETSHAMEFNAGSVVSSSGAAQGLPRKVLAVV